MRAAAFAFALALSTCSKPHIVDAGFWFDGVTFELPQNDIRRLGGPVREDEKTRIESMARAELDAAYAGLRIRFSAGPQGFYRVSVLQDFPAGRLPSAGQSRRLPTGGVGAVNFRTVADHAVAHAPASADRATIIEGIGKGIGRTAVHEFAHQILPYANLHGSKDVSSYEYSSADRVEQYYDRLHWGFAGPQLEATLGKF